MTSTHLRIVKPELDAAMIAEVRGLVSSYACQQPTPSDGFDPQRAYTALHDVMTCNPFGWRAYTGTIPKGGDTQLRLGGRHESLSIIVHIALRGAYARWETLGLFINRDALVAACLYWNALHCQPPLAEDEVRHLVHELFTAELAYRTENESDYQKHFGQM